jgi:hypothetical protein
MPASKAALLGLCVVAFWCSLSGAAPALPTFVPSLAIPPSVRFLYPQTTLDFKDALVSAQPGDEVPAASECMSLTGTDCAQCVRDVRRRFLIAGWFRKAPQYCLRAADRPVLMLHCSQLGGNGWITIRSSASSSLPPNRVTPMSSSYLAQLRSDAVGNFSVFSCLGFAPGAGVKFIGEGAAERMAERKYSAHLRLRN